MVAGSLRNPGRRDWRLGAQGRQGGIGPRRLPAGSPLGEEIGGWESWAEGLQAGSPARLGVLGGMGGRIGGWEYWDTGEEGLVASSPRNPGRRDCRLGVLS